MCRHPFDIIDERLHNGYYDNLPPFFYSRDIATVGYLLGHCSKIDYELARFRYEFANDRRERKPSIIM